MRKAVKWLAALFLGWFLGEYVFKPIVANAYDRWTEPEKRLKLANQRRIIPSKEALVDAIEQYTGLIDKNNPRKKTSVLAEVGLSRAYSQMARIRSWMGYPFGAFPALAVTTALNAQQHGASDPDVGIALAYAYAFGDKTSANEMALAKLAELRSRFPANTDLDYLAWVARENPENEDYLSTVNPNTVPDVAAMLDMALEYVELAKRTSNADKKESHLGRAEDFLAKADLKGAQGLPLSKFVRGMLEDAQGHSNDAQQYFEEALKIDKDFPSAKVNLGVLYATMEPPNFRAAAQKFEDVVQMPGIPLRTQESANIDLGEVDLELDNINEACTHWATAAGVYGDSVSVFYAHVLCNAARGNMKDAIEEFKSTPKGDKIIEKIKHMWPVPRERCLLNAVLQQSMKPRCK